MKLHQPIPGGGKEDSKKKRMGLPWPVSGVVSSIIAGSESETSDIIDIQLIVVEFERYKIVSF